MGRIEAELELIAILAEANGSTAVATLLHDLIAPRAAGRSGRPTGAKHPIELPGTERDTTAHCRASHRVWSHRSPKPD